MLIRRLETIRIAEFPQLIWVVIHTDEGISGLGETFFNASAVEAYLHDAVAPRILGRNALAIDAIARDLAGYLGFRSTGVEMCAASAVNLALWDLLGKATGQPVVQLLGGATRDRIQTYNTCAGARYMRKAETQGTGNWGLAGPSSTGVTGFDDLNDSLVRPGELAESLLAEGIRAMKIWPFDIAAEKTHGSFISSEDMKKAIRPFEIIRNSVGDAIEIMVEFHSMWQLLPAMQIANALRPFRTFWHEDPIRMDSLGDLKRYARSSASPVCASETLGGRWAFRDLLETEAAGVIMFDLAWCGGLTEAKAIADMAEAWRLPIAPHDCTGPVVFTASTHLALNAPNAIFQESVRAFYKGWYREVVTQLPSISDGSMTVPPGPGFGCELVPDIDRKFSVAHRVSEVPRSSAAPPAS